MTPERIEQAAADLFKVERSRTRIGLLSGTNPDLDLDGAYRIREAFIRRKTDAGQQIIGWKIGLTSRAMQSALGIGSPDSGDMFEDMSFKTASDLPDSRFMQPKAKAEIAFEMRSSLCGSRISREDRSAATQRVFFWKSSISGLFARTRKPYAAGPPAT